MRTADGYIISQCLNGNSAAFGVLVDKYKESIYALAYSMLHDFHEAEDITQEAFIKAYEKLHTLKCYDSFHAWLFAITANVCKNWLKSRSKRPDREFIEEQDEQILEEHSMDHYHEELVYQSVRDAMESLPETYCQLLSLHYLGGMNSQEIAEFVGTSPTAIRMRLSRARAQLKEEMIAMMQTTLEEQRLPVGFTLRIVETVKRIRIQPLPRNPGFPWGISIAAGIIIAVLTLGSYISLPRFIDVLADAASISEAPVPEMSEIPVDMLDTSQLSAISGYQGDSNGGMPVLPTQQNAILMAPRGEGGVLPQKPSAQFGKGSIYGIAYSPDGNLLAAVGGPGVRLYDPKTLNEIAIFPGVSYYKVAFSPDGKLLAASDLDCKINLWDVQEQKQIGTLKGHTDICTIAFSPDGRTLASGDYLKTIRIWDIQQQKQIGLLQGHTKQVSSVTFSPDGKILASGSEDQTVRLWDIQGQKQVGLLEGHADWVWSVTFSPDGTTLASGSLDKTVRLWDVQEQKQVGLLQGNSSIGSVAFSPDGRILASASEAIDLWDIKEQKQIGSLHGCEDYWEIIFNPDGNTIASVCNSGGFSVVGFWDVQEQEQTGLLDGFTDGIRSLVFSPDGESLASGERRIIRLWDINGQKQSGLLEKYGHDWSGPVGVAYTPDGKTIASIAWQEIYLFDVQEQKQLGILKGHTGYISSIAFTPDGKILASAGNEDHTVRLWDVAKQKELGVLMNGSWTHCLAISPDGEVLAVSVGAEKLVRLWDIKTQKEIGVLQDTCAAFSVAISPDGKTVASGNQCGEIILWDMKSQKQVGVLQGPVSATQVTFSPDGKWLVSVGCYNGNGIVDNITRIWDIQKQEQIATIEGHTGKVNTVTFSPDGKWMASGGEDGIILLWEVDISVPGQAVEPTGKLPGTWGGLRKTELLQNYPNPSNPETWIPYQLADSGDVRLTIHNSAGQLVRDLQLGSKPEGAYINKDKAVHWDGRNEAGESVASGVYFYTLAAGEFRQTRKMTILR